MGERRIPRYEFPTVRANAGSLTDFNLIKGRAQIPHDSGIRVLPGYDSIGTESSGVVNLATGIQTLINFWGGFVTMKLYGSGSRSGFAQDHLVYEHGSPEENKRAMVGLDHMCPGCQLELDCGCRSNTDGLIRSMYGRSPTNAVYIALDPFSNPEERMDVARVLLTARNSVNTPYIHSTPGFESDCLTVRALKKKRQIQKVYKAGDEVFLKTHDLQVTFRNGHPARLIVLEEPAKTDKRGYAGKPRHHYVLVYGDLSRQDTVIPFRNHSLCTTSEYGGNGCDCRTQREIALERIKERGLGVLVLEDADGMRTGSVAKLWQTALTGSEITDLLTARERYLGIEKDMRTYSLLEVIRQELGLKRVEAITNNLQKIAVTQNHGIEVVAAWPIMVNANQYASHARNDFNAKQNDGKYLRYTHT